MLYVGLQKNLKKRNDHTEDEPDVNHLDVGGLRESVGDSHVEGGQDQHHRQVDGDDGLKVEPWEVDRGVAHYVEEQGGQEDIEEDAKQTSSKSNLHSDAKLSTKLLDGHGLIPDREVWDGVYQFHLLYVVLSQVMGPSVGEGLDIETAEVLQGPDQS